MPGEIKNMPMNSPGTPSAGPVMASRPVPALTIGTLEGNGAAGGAMGAGVGAGAGVKAYFKPVSAIMRPPRIALSLEALDKCGKSHWAIMTPPGPLVVAMTDDGTEYVLRKAKAAGRPVAGVLDLHYTRPATIGKSQANETLQKEWREKWELFKNGMNAVAADKSIRTVVRDTETEIWQLAQLAYFGRLTQIPQHLRTECNADYLRTFRVLYGREDLNIVLVHQLKKEYKPNSKGEADWTGKYERDGMNKIGFAVDLVLRAGWDGNRRSFYTQVPTEQATRFGADLAGKQWYGEESGFGYLGMELFPETGLTPEVWGL